MTLGTFRDQLIYPDSEADMAMKGVNDGDLMQYLEQVSIRECQFLVVNLKAK